MIRTKGFSFVDCSCHTLYYIHILLLQSGTLSQHVINNIVIVENEVVYLKGLASGMCRGKGDHPMRQLYTRAHACDFIWRIYIYLFLFLQQTQYNMSIAIIMRCRKTFFRYREPTTNRNTPHVLHKRPALDHIFRQHNFRNLKVQGPWVEERKEVEVVVVVTTGGGRGFIKKRRHWDDSVPGRKLLWNRFPRNRERKLSPRGLL